MIVIDSNVAREGVGFWATEKERQGSKERIVTTFSMEADGAVSATATATAPSAPTEPIESDRLQRLFERLAQETQVVALENKIAQLQAQLRELRTQLNAESLENIYTETDNNGRCVANLEDQRRILDLLYAHSNNNYGVRKAALFWDVQNVVLAFATEGLLLPTWFRDKYKCDL